MPRAAAEAGGAGLTAAGEQQPGPPGRGGRSDRPHAGNNQRHDGRGRGSYQRACLYRRALAPALDPLPEKRRRLDHLPRDRIGLLVERRGELPLQVLIGEHACILPPSPVSPGASPARPDRAARNRASARWVWDFTVPAVHPSTAAVSPRPVLPEPQHQHGPLLQRQQPAGMEQHLPVQHRSATSEADGRAAGSTDSVSAGWRCQARHRSLTRLSRTVLLTSPETAGSRPVRSRPQQCLLGQILGIVPVAGQEEREAEQLPAVPGHESPRPSRPHPPSSTRSRVVVSGCHHEARRDQVVSGHEVGRK